MHPQLILRLRDAEGVSAGLVGCGVCGRVGRVWESEKGVWEGEDNLDGSVQRKLVSF